jgi:Flp pilus assembly protein TadG
MIRGIGRHLKAGERGQSLVEFSLIAIVFFAFIFGIFDSARLFQSWMTVQHSAREGARYAITGQVICAGETDNRPACITQKAKASTTGLVGGGVSGTAIGVTTKYWDYPAFSGSGTSGAGGQCDQIEVTVTYTHHFATPILQAIAPSGVLLKGSQRMTNEPFGQCS